MPRRLSYHQLPVLIIVGISFCPVICVLRRIVLHSSTRPVRTQHRKSTNLVDHNLR